MQPNICAELTVSPQILSTAAGNVRRKAARLPRNADATGELLRRSELYRTLELTHPQNRLN